MSPGRYISHVTIATYPQGLIAEVDSREGGMGGGTIELALTLAGPLLDQPGYSAGQAWDGAEDVDTTGSDPLPTPIFPVSMAEMPRWYICQLIMQTGLGCLCRLQRVGHRSTLFTSKGSLV